MLKKISLGILLTLSVNGFAAPITINGKIMPVNSPITVLKIWGTHHERGLAYGYLLGDKISSTFSLYSKTLSKCKYKKVREIIKLNVCYTFDKEMVIEAKAIVEGMNFAGSNALNIDYIDLLIINTLFDIGGLECLSGFESFACSSLISWGEATRNTGLNGESVVSRHFDWWNPEEVLKSQVVIIHIPSEALEQPWANVGIAGQIGAVSAMNKNGVAVFLHAAPFTGLKGKKGNTYEPVLFSLRKGIERRDFNNDGENDVLDIQSILSSNRTGYSKPCIVSVAAKTSGRTKDKAAVIAELSPQPPYCAFRGNEYPDDIPGDNLYVANSFLKLKNRRKHGNRNNEIISAIGNGNTISSEKNWELLRDHSRFKVPFNIESNIQFMQYIPYRNTLKLSVSTDKTPAYLLKPEELDLNLLFKEE